MSGDTELISGAASLSSHTLLRKSHSTQGHPHQAHRSSPSPTILYSSFPKPFAPIGMPLHFYSFSASWIPAQVGENQFLQFFSSSFPLPSFTFSSTRKTKKQTHKKLPFLIFCLACHSIFLSAHKQTNTPQPKRRSFPFFVQLYLASIFRGCFSLKGVSLPAHPFFSTDLCDCSTIQALQNIMDDPPTVK